MKELTIKEKAKAYDEVRKKIAIRFGSNVADEIFSQFEESEDEKIRKALINGFNKLDKSAVWYNGITNAQILAWLERQGQDGKVWFYRDDYVRDKKQAYQDGIDNVLNNPQKYGLEKQREQKPVEWSDKDETGWTSTMIMIKECAANHYTKDSIDFVINWLKSIKDRYLPQPMQERGKENEELRLDCIKNLEQQDPLPTSIYAEWLKSLRPQKQWKPSEEQIRAFEWAYKSSKIEEGSQYDIDCKDLLEQLKAL